ncbi:MAG: glycosyltransferase, partial [Candidatus Andersenbacteria bacterium]|nr:glycosyltransferase [Candidatus Andersenbacteria bacterium]
SGKPIVAAGVPELKEYSAYISYAENADEFIAGIERALAEGEKRRESRQALAREHSWEKRAEQLRRLLEETVQRRRGKGRL